MTVNVSYCLMLLLEIISWRDGQDICESHGGYLAEVKTESQQTFLVRKIFFFNLNSHPKNIKESLAMLEEEFVGPRSWFIGLTDFGHEGRYRQYSVLDILASLLNI